MEVKVEEPSEDKTASFVNPDSYIIQEETLDFNLLPPDFYEFSENQVNKEVAINEDIIIDEPKVGVGLSNTNKLINKYRNSFQYKPPKQETVEKVIIFKSEAFL